MAISIKFTKFDNTPWGFRLAGGSDFPQPLTVIRVTEGSLAECMGLKIGDVIVRLNDQPISNLTHGQAHEELMHAGNNFVLGVQREEEARKAAEAISEENIVPYKIALADLPPVFPEQILKEETVIERYEEDKIVVEQTAQLSAEDEIRQEEDKLADEKPVDANSEIVPNKNLTDDEIAQLILEEEELLSNKGLLGVNFNKLRPRVPILKGSKVLAELQHIATAEPERVQELKRTSTFLQKPQGPIPRPKLEQKTEGDDAEGYKVVIKKQDKKTVIARLVEKGLLPPGSEASVTVTPEPPVLFEVKMHEMENGSKEELFPVVSDPNPPCPSVVSHDIDAMERDSRKTSSSEDQSMRRCATYKCKPKLVHVKPSHYRKSSYNGRHNEITAKTSCKTDRKVENGDDHARSCAACSDEPRFYPQSTRVTIARVKRTRMKGKYLSTYLQRESIRLMSLMTKLFEFFLPEVSESPSMPDLRRRRSSFKGYYLEHVLQRNVGPVLESVKETYLVNDPKMMDEKKDDSKSAEECLYRNDLQNPRVRSMLANCVEQLAKYVRASSEWLASSPSCTSRKELPAVTASSSIVDDSDGKISEWHEDGPSCPLQRKSAVLVSFSDDASPRNANYDENDFDVLECSGDLAIGETERRRPVSEEDEEEEEDNISKLLQLAEDYISAEVFHRGSRRLSRPRNSIDTLPKEENNGLEKFLQSAEDYVSSEVFHRGNRRLSKPRKSIDIVPAKDDKALEKFLQSAEDYFTTEIFHRGSRRLSKSRKSIDAAAANDDNGLEKFLQSAEDYFTAEIFHRGSRRLSKARKSVDILPEEDNSTLKDFLKSAEGYVSAEVFHRGSRRLSKSRKSIDAAAEKDDNPLEKFLQSAEKYVSSEVFHRGNRRFSKSRKSMDAAAEKDDNSLEKFLQSAENYVSSEIFHRGNRRLSKSRRSIDAAAEGDDSALEKFLQSAEDYISAEVFHRRSRRLSLARGKDVGEENGVVSNLLRSTGDYVSSEVFHRKSRRLSRCFRRESIPPAAPTWWSMLKNINLSLPWFSFRVTKKNSEYGDVYDEKIAKSDSEIERNSRRLSVVPTILYRGVTNCIGVNFTRLVAYAFVPCTSIILLYMYKWSISHPV